MFCVSLCHQSHTTPTDFFLWKSSSRYFTCSWTFSVSIHHQTHKDTYFWKSSSGYFAVSWTPSEPQNSHRYLFLKKVVLVILYFHEWFVYPYAIRATQVPHILPSEKVVLVILHVLERFLYPHAIGATQLQILYSEKVVLVTLQVPEHFV